MLCLVQEGLRIMTRFGFRDLESRGRIMGVSDGLGLSRLFLFELG
jgi:hypothetical protein